MVPTFANCKPRSRSPPVSTPSPLSSTWTQTLLGKFPYHLRHPQNATEFCDGLVKSAKRKHLNFDNKDKENIFTPTHFKTSQCNGDFKNYPTDQQMAKLCAAISPSTPSSPPLQPSPLHLSTLPPTQPSSPSPPVPRGLPRG